MQRYISQLVMYHGNRCRVILDLELKRVHSNMLYHPDTDGIFGRRLEITLRSLNEKNDKENKGV